MIEPLYGISANEAMDKSLSAQVERDGMPHTYLRSELSQMECPMTKVVTRVALFRFGVKRFTSEVNTLLADGWKLDNFSIEQRLLRMVCIAVLSK